MADVSSSVTMRGIFEMFVVELKLPSHSVKSPGSLVRILLFT